MKRNYGVYAELYEPIILKAAIKVFQNISAQSNFIRTSIKPFWKRENTHHKSLKVFQYTQTHLHIQRAH